MRMCLQMAAGSKVSGKRVSSASRSNSVTEAAASSEPALNTREAKRALDPFANVFKGDKHYEIDDIHAVVSWAGILLIYASYVTWICFGYVAEYEPQVHAASNPFSRSFTRYIRKVLVFFGLTVNPIAAPKVCARLSLCLCVNACIATRVMRLSCVSWSISGSTVFISVQETASSGTPAATTSHAARF